jgi:hypothetical protein
MTWPVAGLFGTRTLDRDEGSEDVAVALGSEDPVARRRLLAEAGFGVADGYVTEGGKPVRDPYFGGRVAVDDAVLLPAEAAVVEAHPLSVACVLDEES